MNTPLITAAAAGSHRQGKAGHVPELWKEAHAALGFLKVSEGQLVLEGQAKGAEHTELSLKSAAWEGRVGEAF